MTLTKLLRDAKENEIDFLWAKKIYEKVNYRVYEKEINKQIKRETMDKTAFSVIDPKLEEKSYQIAKRYIKLYFNQNNN